MIYMKTISYTVQLTCKFTVKYAHSYVPRLICNKTHVLVACCAIAFSAREHKTSAFNVRESQIMHATTAQLHLMHTSVVRVYASAFKG